MIMKKYWKLMLLTACMFGAFTLASCNDDDDATVDQIYYISTDPSATTYPTTFSLSLVDNSVGVPSFFYIVGKSTMRVGQNTTLSIEEDRSLIEAYNKTNGKEYLPLPEDTYSFSTNQVTITSGENFSSDTIFVSFKNWDKLSKTDKYILPVSLKSISDNGVISANKNVIYFIADFSTNNVGYHKPAGWKAIDRTNWIVDYSYAYNDDEAGYGGQLAIDDDISTAWFSWGVANAGECWWSATLDTPATLTGLSITRQIDFGDSYNVKAIQVKVKKEGDTEWTEGGSFQLGSFDGNAPQYVLFTPALENVKEFRVDITSPTNFAGFAELNLYKQ